MNNHESAESLHLEQYLVSASAGDVRCVDERSPRETPDDGLGVQIPGGIYGIIDALKALNHLSEDDAWKLAAEKDIPPGAHTDEHHGANGCGYANKVEKDPAVVGAPEAVPANDRLNRVRKNNSAYVVELLGDHHPTHASVNFRKGQTVNPAKASRDGLGLFNFDAWAAEIFAQKLGVDRTAMTDHLLTVYKKTVTALTGITKFHELR